MLVPQDIVLSGFTGFVLSVFAISNLRFYKFSLYRTHVNFAKNDIEKRDCQHLLDSPFLFVDHVWETTLERRCLGDDAARVVKKTPYCLASSKGILTINHYLLLHLTRCPIELSV